MKVVIIIIFSIAEVVEGMNVLNTIDVATANQTKKNSLYHNSISYPLTNLTLGLYDKSCGFSKI